MIYLGNAFSLQMLGNKNCKIRVRRLNPENVKKILERNNWISIVGHTETAKFLSSILDVDIPYNRMAIKLHPRDTLIVAQYIGGRANGEIVLDPSLFEFYLVKVLI